MSGQYVAYTFFRADPAWRRLPVEERAAAKDAFAEVLDEFTPRFEHLRVYSTTGIRPETDFFLWKITERYEDLGELGAALNGTPLAGWLETPYSYLATTKASQYTSARKARKITPKNLPYLVVYPFVKVRPWYSLTEDVRQRAMDEHIRIGREEFPGIYNHTTYSFGIDDEEFMTAFECDEPADFMHLMLRLRDSEASALHRARHADLRRTAHADPRGARPPRRRRLIRRRRSPLGARSRRARARPRAGRYRLSSTRTPRPRCARRCPGLPRSRSSSSGGWAR